MKNNEIVPGFDNNKRFVKVPHLSNHTQFPYMGRVTYAVIRIVSISKRRSTVPKLW